MPGDLKELLNFFPEGPEFDLLNALREIKDPMYVYPILRLSQIHLARSVLARIAAQNLKTCLKGKIDRESDDDYRRKYRSEHLKKTFESIAEEKMKPVCEILTFFFLG